MKVWDLEVLYKLRLEPSKLKKYSILYSTSKGEMGLSEEGTLQWDKVSRKLIKQCCKRGTQGFWRTLQAMHTMALGLIITNSSIQREKLRFQDLRSQLLPRPWPQAIAGFDKVFLIQRRSSAHHILGPQEKPWLVSRASPSQIPEEDGSLLVFLV